VDVDAESDTPSGTQAATESAVGGDVVAGPAVPEPSVSPEAIQPAEPDATSAVVPPRRYRHRHWRGHGRSTAARVGFGVGKSVVAVTAAAMLAVTGYNWSLLHRLDQGIARTNVFDTTAAPTSSGNGSALAAPPPLTSDVNILLVGMDSRTDPHGNPLPADELAMLHAGPDTGELNTDTMILVHIPAGGQQATAISFPRDSYVQLAGGFGHDRLNSAFAYAYNSTVTRLRAQGMTNTADIIQQAKTAGRKNLIATIEALIGNSLTINRYAEINLGGFYDMSQAVGGVQVCLKAATHDDYTGASFQAGIQPISGVQALNFVRQRHGLPGGDLDRITRQQVFLGALANKILSTGTLTSPDRIAALTTAIQNSITLSSGWDITSFAAQMQGLSSGAIQFSTIPTGPNIVVNGAQVIQVDPTRIAQYVQDTTGQSVTAPTTTGTPGDTGTGAAAASTTTPTAATGSTAPPTTTTPTTTTEPITANGIRCVN
jgi:LCP family protein required for cell wall assembly